MAIWINVFGYLTIKGFKTLKSMETTPPEPESTMEWTAVSEKKTCGATSKGAQGSKYGFKGKGSMLEVCYGARGLSHRAGYPSRSSRPRTRDPELVPTTTHYKWWNCQVFRPANCCQHIPSNRFHDGFPDPSRFAAVKLTHYSSEPQRPSDSSRSWQRILLSGDVHPNPGPTTKYQCPVCARNVTSRGVSYLCNCCSGWVQCSGLQNAAEYRRIKDWVCSYCNSPPTLPKLQPPPIPTQAEDQN